MFTAQELRNQMAFALDAENSDITEMIWIISLQSMLQ